MSRFTADTTIHQPRSLVTQKHIPQTLITTEAIMMTIRPSMSTAMVTLKSTVMKKKVQRLILKIILTVTRIIMDILLLRMAIPRIFPIDIWTIKSTPRKMKMKKRQQKLITRKVHRKILMI